jgi:ADP-ribose pyrophosphatase
MIETTKTPISVTVKETVYQDHIRRIYRKVAEFEGFTKQYLVSESGERAALLVSCGSYVLLTRQYRLLIDGISLEIPGGKVDDNETPQETAARECFEETGVMCQNLTPLQNYYPGLDITHNPTYIFHSDNPDMSSVKRTERAVWLPLDTCLEMVFAGKIPDAMTIIALLAYSARSGVPRENKSDIQNEVNPVCFHAQRQMKARSADSTQQL